MCNLMFMAASFDRFDITTTFELQFKRVDTENY